MEVEDKELSHYGVPGMKWGVRRSQAQLDKAASRRSNSPAAKRKEAKGMSDNELKTTNKRLQMEKQYVELTANKADNAKIKKGAKIAGDLVGQIGKQVVAQQSAKRINKAIDTLFDKK